MIVGSRFEGDDDSHLMWLQHDVYPKALLAITTQIKLLSDFAEDYVGIKRSPFARSYDHRNLQNAHDLLAARFRFQYQTTQFQLPFAGELSLEEQDQVHVQAWLDWLREEYQSWVEAPRLVRLFRDLVVEDDNAYLNYWEHELMYCLILRFQTVPWLKAYTDQPQPERPLTPLMRRAHVP